jgi:hypothetical protein
MHDTDLLKFLSDVVAKFNKLDWKLTEDGKIISEIVIKDVDLDLIEIHERFLICFEFGNSVNEWGLHIEYRKGNFRRMDVKTKIGDAKKVLENLSSWLSAMKTAFNNVVD